MKRRMKRRSRRVSWRTASAEPNTALKASWETDVSELLTFQLLMWKKVLAVTFGVIYFRYFISVPPDTLRSIWEDPVCFQLFIF